MMRQRGFSLLELSVVLAIVAVVLVFGLNIATIALRGSERMTTQSRLQIVQEALDNYARMTGHLPCPSSRALTPASASFGFEARNTTTNVDCLVGSPGVVRAPAAGTPFVYIGTVPTRTLGLPDSYAGDAWGGKLTYAVSAAHVGSNDSYFLVDGPIIMRAGNAGATNYIISTTRETTGTNAAGAAGVYVVVSHGKDGRGAFPVNGTAVGLACSSTATDGHNCDASDLVFYDTPINDGNQTSTGFFDDFVVWRSNALERQPTLNGGPMAGCSTGICALWCAPCDPTFPPNIAPYAICKRTITSSSPCQAFCEYAYPTTGSLCP